VDGGRLLRQARRRAKLSQRALAELSGVPQPAIARIESGRVSPRVRTLDGLLRLCGERLDAVPWMDSGVDRTQIRERLKWTVAQRLDELESMAEDFARLKDSAL
jgi:transcriptional regulator with XRE-family HTH domain